MDLTKIHNVEIRPKVENTVFQNFLYGQTGTKAISRLHFATTTENPSAVFKWGFMKNSTPTFIPSSFVVDPQNFNQLNTSQQQAYVGNESSMAFMSPLSGEDGKASMIAETVIFDKWDENTFYFLGDIAKKNGTNYIAIQDDFKNKKPNIKVLYWSPVFTYYLEHEFIIQPYTSLDDFNGNNIYTKSDYLLNAESVKYVYQIEVKTTPENPVILSSTKDFDPLILDGAVGFLEEKLNGNPRDVILSDLVINDNLFAVEGEKNNLVTFKLNSESFPLSLATSYVQIIAYKLNYELNTNVKFLDQIDFSSIEAKTGEVDGMLNTAGIIESGNGLLVNFNFNPTPNDDIIVYINVISDTTQLTNQSFRLFSGTIQEAAKVEPFELRQIYNTPDASFIFFHEYLNINTSIFHKNVAAFVDDILICKVEVQKKNDFAISKGITVALVNNNNEILQSVSYNNSQLPIVEPTNYNINEVGRENIQVTYFNTSDYYSIIYPFQIKEFWTAKTDIRVVLTMDYELEGVSDSTVIKSPPFRLGTYDQTKNSDTEPQVLAKFDEKIKLMSEDGSININQLNLGSSIRLVAEFEDKNTLTNSLQVEESELTGYFGISQPQQSGNLHYVTKEFGTLGSTFYKNIDGSTSPACKITKLDVKTAKVEAIVDVDELVNILGESDNYNIVCRLDKKEAAFLTVDQYTFIFNQNTSQSYEYTLDSDLLKQAFLSVYYSVNYPNIIEFFHAATFFASTDFEVFKAHINGNGASGEKIVLTWTTFTGSVYESIVKLNIPRTAASPETSIGLNNTLFTHYLENENLYAFDNKIKLSSFFVSGASSDELYYALRGVDSELTEFKPYTKSSLNADINASETPFILHLWGARNGNADNIGLYYDALGATELLKYANVYGENTLKLRPVWDVPSMVVGGNQYVIVGNNTTPYKQIEVRDVFTFYFVFWSDDLVTTRKQIFTTNSQLSGTPNPFLSFNIAQKKFNVTFTATEGATIKTLNFSGLGVKKGYNFVVGRWDPYSLEQRHIFVNGLLQAGEILNVNDFDIDTDTVLNSYDDALFFANDYDTTVSEYFKGKIFDAKLSTEIFNNRVVDYRKAMLKGELTFLASSLLLNVDFHKADGIDPTITDGTNVYPISTLVSPTYTDFDDLT